jgi:hypothetical protein
MLGLRLHLLHQPRALDRCREARVIFDVGGDGELAAGCMPWITIGFIPARAA